MKEKELTERERLRLSLALLPHDAKQVSYLRKRLSDAEPAELLVIRDALVPHADQLSQRLWEIASDAQLADDARFRAACTLAGLDPGADKAKWDAVSTPVAKVLVSQNPLVLGAWMEALRPVRRTVVPPLQEIFRDPKQGEGERSLAASILADYAADQPDVLTDLLLGADTKQFIMLLSAVQAIAQEAVPLLEAELGRRAAEDATEAVLDQLGSRQANAAAALLRLNSSEKAWQLFQHRPDPTARSYLIHRVSPLGVDPKMIVARLDKEQDVSIRRALILCLGEYDADDTQTSPTRERGNPTAPTGTQGNPTSPTRERGNPMAPTGTQAEESNPSLALARRASVTPNRGPNKLPTDERQRLLPTLFDLYRDDPDPGLHGAVEWLLRQWHQGNRLKALDEQLAQDRAQAKR
ncbi:MAG: hypothetical protein NTY19_02080, partial [Planctomycetota bacterium]|nr:hypothetical protein [Planctomycetota bacterium]